MRLGGDMGPNMGTTIDKIAYATNGRKINSASQIYSSRVTGLQEVSAVRRCSEGRCEPRSTRLTTYSRHPFGHPSRPQRAALGAIRTSQHAPYNYPAYCMGGEQAGRIGESM
ncbi:hypothetical protein E2C01_081056 [Portunus trituberculatus]|uniref:Uncharacterized protein n=1 Tax=Portunus trituberculatus TaxID=210409 RepID=A0A5B7IUT0_PORTR|nr:hypothetical protein [Portunus trituberculatus]